MDKTWIDEDDDDEEFDDAIKEEEEDLKNNDISSFMVSKANVSRFHDISKIEFKNIEKPRKKVKSQLEKIKEELIPNKILDSMILSSGIDDTPRKQSITDDINQEQDDGR